MKMEYDATQPLPESDLVMDEVTTDVDDNGPVVEPEGLILP